MIRKISNYNKPILYICLYYTYNNNELKQQIIII